MIRQKPSQVTPPGLSGGSQSLLFSSNRVRGRGKPMKRLLLVSMILSLALAPGFSLADSVPAPSSKSVWKEKSLRIHLSSGVVPVIVVRPGFATDIEVDFPLRRIVRGNSSWSIGTDRTLEFRRDHVRHIVVRVPKKRGETRYTNMVLIRIDGHPYSFTLKEASPSHPETFNTLVFVSKR